MSQVESLSPQIVSKLAEVRQLLRKYVLWQSACLAILWFLCVFWLGGLIDYLPVRVGASETPRWARIGMLMAIVLGVLWIVARFLLPKLLKKIPDSSLALVFERRFPQLGNALVTAVELVDQPGKEITDSNAYQQMLNSVHQDADTAIVSIETSELFNWRPLRMVMTVTGIGLLVTVGICIAQAGWMQMWAARLFALSDARWPREAELRIDGIQLQVPNFTGELGTNRILVPFIDAVARVGAGSEALLQISASTQAAKTPELCTLFYRSSGGSRGRANLRRIGNPVEGWQGFNIDGPPMDGITEDLAFDVVGLDARIRNQRIEVVVPAAVADMQIECSYPRYLMDSLEGTGASRPAVELLKYRSGQKIPEGTVVALKGTASCPLSRVEYMVLSSAASAEQDDREEGNQVMRLDTDSAEFSIPLGQIFSNQVVEVRLVDQYGLPAEQIPRYILTVESDTLPEVDSRLAGIGSAVTAKAMLPIRGSVVDDHGVASVVAELALDDSERMAVPLPLANSGDLESEIDLAQLAEQGKLLAKPGQALRVSVTATDFYDLTDDPHIGQGQPQQLSVVTEDELLVILDRQEIEQRQRLELIYSELEQLRDLLDDLHTLYLAEPEPESLDALGEPLSVEAAQKQRIRRLGIKAQQSVLQADKSQQELISLIARIDSLRLQLVNNRIDSYDRQQRLQTKVLEPLRGLMDKRYAEFRSLLATLMTKTRTGSGQTELARSRVVLDDILVDLTEIKTNMLNMQSFNELIDLVRGLLDEQDVLLDETQAEQRKRILDFLN